MDNLLWKGEREVRSAGGNGPIPSSSPSSCYSAYYPLFINLFWKRGFSKTIASNTAPIQYQGARILKSFPCALQHHGKSERTRRFQCECERRCKLGSGLWSQSGRGGSLGPSQRQRWTRPTAPRGGPRLKPRYDHLGAPPGCGRQCWTIQYVKAQACTWPTWANRSRPHCRSRGHLLPVWIRTPLFTNRCRALISHLS